ncbi:MAG TPA: pantoate--beta-alanine ligase [Acidimicrobiia bacterium]|nr:pantoate--beta-alanine ligase [Acidimicrobiia bacterium]
MEIVEYPGEARAVGSGLRGLVPTMGYLHEGHISLAEAARRMCDVVVMSLFVNPLQFEDPADLDRYPRDLERDAALAEKVGVDVLFAPPLEIMFPSRPLTTVTVSSVADEMEGRHRPGHFAGVATVVAKLFAALRPDRSFFGRKDHQQLVVIRRMNVDLSFPGEVIGCPTVREPDGLALSSRNVFIVDRPRALTISRALEAVAAAVEKGERRASKLIEVARDELKLDAVDYVTLASQADARPIETLDRPAFLAIAGHLGDVRLIDNLPLDLVGEMFVPDTGIRLDRPSNLLRR